jgi:hypothetical protein
MSTSTSITQLDSKHFICSNECGFWLFPIPSLDTAEGEIQDAPVHDYHPMWQYQAVFSDTWELPLIAVQRTRDDDTPSLLMCTGNSIHIFHRLDPAHNREWTREEIKLKSGGFSTGSVFDSSSGILYTVSESHFRVVKIPIVDHRGMLRLEHTDFDSITVTDVSPSALSVRRRKEEKVGHISYDAESGMVVVLFSNFNRKTSTQDHRLVIACI